jgi:hypothetical protein
MYLITFILHFYFVKRQKNAKILFEKSAFYGLDLELEPEPEP